MITDKSKLKEGVDASDRSDYSIFSSHLKQVIKGDKGVGMGDEVELEISLNFKKPDKQYPKPTLFFNLTNITLLKAAPPPVYEDEFEGFDGGDESAEVEDDDGWEA